MQPGHVASRQLSPLNTAAEDVVSFNAAISGCEKAADWQRALQFLREIRLRRLQPTVITCSACRSTPSDLRHSFASQLVITTSFYLLAVMPLLLVAMPLLIVASSQLVI